MTEENQGVKTFTQADIDKLNEEHANALKELETRLKGEQDRKVDAAIKKTKAEIEEAAKKASMTETEKLNAELEEYKTKYHSGGDRTIYLIDVKGNGDNVFEMEISFDKDARRNGEEK